MKYIFYFRNSGLTSIFETEQTFADKTPIFYFAFDDLEKAKAAKKFIEGKNFRSSDLLLKWVMDGQELLTLHPVGFGFGLTEK